MAFLALAGTSLLGGLSDSGVLNDIPVVGGTFQTITSDVNKVVGATLQSAISMPLALLGGGLGGGSAASSGGGSSLTNILLIGGGIVVVGGVIYFVLK